MTQRSAWLRQRKRFFLRTAVTALVALVIGFTIGVERSGACFPAFDRDSLLRIVRSGWPFALGAFLLIMLLDIWVGRALHSPHLATRLILWELMAAVLLLAAMVGCLVLAMVQLGRMDDWVWLFQQLLPILASCSLVFLFLFWITRRLLAPLDSIRRTLEEFYTCGGGNTIPLTGIPHTELYEMSRVFNQLSLQARTQMNDLQAVNAAYQRLVPNSLLQILDKPDVSALKPGDTITQTASLLVLALREPESSLEQSVPVIHQAADSIGAFGGMVVDHDEELKALIALFPTWKQALACAQTALGHRLPVTAALLREQVVFGVFGGEHLLLPLALSAHMARRFALIALLRQFGARDIRCDGDTAQLRLLGWDDGLTFYEETRWRGSAWNALWQEAKPLWDQAMESYQQGRFAPAMRKLAQFLSVLPDDQAARWYLFRCNTLRDEGVKPPNLDLLAHWEGCL